MKKSLLLLIASLAAVSACVYPYNPEVEVSEEHIPVIEGDILVGGTSRVRMSYMQPLGAGHYFFAPPEVSSVWVEDMFGRVYPGKVSQETVSFQEFEVDTRSAGDGVSFRLHVDMEGNSFVSDWQQVLEPPVIEDIKFAKDTNFVYVNVDMSAPEGSDGLVGLDFSEAWSFHAPYEADLLFDPETLSIIDLMFHPELRGSYHRYCYQNFHQATAVLVDASTMGNAVRDFTFQTFLRTDERIQEKYFIELSARSLSPETYRYMKHLEEASSVGGDLFSPDPGDMAGNLVCETDERIRVLGFVTASRITKMKKQMDHNLRAEYYVRPPLPELREIEPENYLMYYRDMQFVPINEVSDYSDGGMPRLVIKWGPLRCVDCVAAGGTLEKPEMWED